MNNGEILDYIAQDTRNKMEEYLMESIDELLLLWDKGIKTGTITQYVYLLFGILENNFYIERTEKIKEIIFNILQSKKEAIYKGKVEELNGILDGLLLFSYTLVKYDLLLDIRLINYNKYLVELSEQAISIALDKVKGREVTFSYYDLITGCAGFLKYLININSRNIKLIFDICEYLSVLSEEKEYKNKKITGYHIKRENQFLEIERKTQLNGHINFGVAHGIVSPIVSLTEVYKKYNKQELKGIIDKLLSLYEEVENKCEVISYPMQLKYEDFIKKEYLGREISSWCYGNIGIARALMIIYKNINDDSKYTKYKEELISIVNQPYEKYALECTYLCHGLSGVLAIQIQSYIETKDARFLCTLDRNINKLISLEEEGFLGVNEYKEDVSLLEGRAGVILTLLSIFSGKVIFKDMMLI